MRERWGGTLLFVLVAFLAAALFAASWQSSKRREAECEGRGGVWVTQYMTESRCMDPGVFR